MKSLKSVSISNSDKLSLISNMATMLKAGISIIEIIDSLMEDAKGGQKIVLETLKADLAQGYHISSSFEKFPKVFDKITISLLRASEEAGTLDTTLNDLRENIRKETEFRDKIKGALTYPMFIMLVFVGVLVMMLFVVIPKISEVFSRLDVELPLPTQILIVLSNFLVNNTLFVVVGFVVLAIVLFFLFKSQKSLVTNTLLSLPVVSKLGRDIDLTRFTRSLYLLLSAGITIGPAIELTQGVVNKKDISDAIKRSQEMVMSGKKLSEGLKEGKRVFPTILIKMTEAGEKTGSLDKSMEDAAEYLDYQVSNTLRTFTALLEPIMLIFVGILVGGMMLAIIAPIYNIIGQVGQ